MTLREALSKNNHDFITISGYDFKTNRVAFLEIELDSDIIIIEANDIVTNKPYKIASCIMDTHEVRFLID